ncbi:AraC family transcriptional regulator [Paenibacillus sp. N4]|uniref:helix-turn-helix domain-containing protein n=1 Tax=Paenibacillus vietnamensis TaxID=2590547 RepID=UPI001CD08BE5|nr:AraC family transcriptional regulator [Paenibacillus vietnamensis]MCA0756557.1 AraC family transcriptional regulator [Paenibacillus vietnamensis]
MSITGHMPSMGILQLHEGEKKFQLTRHAPSGPLSPFVKHYWIVSWNLEGQPPYCQDVVPNPCVNLVMEEGKSGIYGAACSKYTQRLEGKGQVFGIKFRPGGFYPFLGSELSGLKGGALPLEAVFGAGAAPYGQAISQSPEAAARIALTEALLLERLPANDDNISEINRIIDYITEDPGLTRVEQLCERFGMNKRRLQRLFSRYVGVTPKWVIRLYRLQNAAEALEGGLQHDLAKLSVELGYYDQSHFIKDFKSIIGKTPDEYASPLP